MRDDMKIVLFCGHRSPFGSHHIEPLLNSRFDVVGVILATPHRWQKFRVAVSGLPERPTDSTIRYKLIRKLLVGHLSRDLTRRILAWFMDHSGIIGNKRHRQNRKIQPISDIDRFLKAKRVPTFYFDDVNSDSCVRHIRSLNVDLLMCAAYPQIFKLPLLTVTRLGAVNYHPSLLPKYRGAHPIYWVLARGEKSTGLTAHFMTEDVDAGDIIAKLEVPIYVEDDYQSLYKRVISRIPEVIKEAEECLLDGWHKPSPQDAREATYFRSDREIHHRIFWRLQKPEEIWNLVRAGNAFAFYRNEKIVLHKVQLTAGNRNLTNGVVAEPGTIVDVGQDYVSISIGSSCLVIKELSYILGYMNAWKFIRSCAPTIGEMLS